MLKAMARPLSDTAVPLSTGETFDALKQLYLERREVSNINHRLAELSFLHASDKSTREENELLLHQLHLVQEELERAKLGATKQHATYVSAEKQLEASAAELDRLRALEKDTREENELLLYQLHMVQEHLEKLLNVQLQADDNSAADQSELQRLAEFLEKNAEPEKRQCAGGFRNRWKEKRQNKKERKALLRTAAVIERTHFFDGHWYLNQYPDIAADEKAASNPAFHYLKYGGFEGRNPGPHFDSAYYLEANPDVAASGMNPLVHYVKFGKDEGREAAFD
jgi:hypothetical protein